ncbi:hypothetical protein HMPREF3086_03160 [Dietzia sp. HMSC21D01]|uniref:Ig-like domain repeat protein n=4 Tax=Dietzia cinnamea TaxID=321318 RepID=A0ABV3YI49_9ACTN|nr:MULTISPECIES: Ig-like domain-containing protein [Dietzia]MCT2031919.1 Ig-like domain-containing protein [Dietzia cinnamea]MCT2099751.1 Ig-like domain-containing protein [Dietzia cinnamea]MCT2107639.1 Ig-like domain-containing protein [Dietzia cinnamea]MCT2221860.1 Ig-like domain-containing protein [Dietzia cinnamea]OFS25414.1 hypothetical protein HMPREF3086_03160 [Dietzia sp. HMSC21D01]
MTTREIAAPTAPATTTRLARALTALLSAFALLLGLAPAATAQTGETTAIDPFRVTLSVSGDLRPGGEVTYTLRATNTEVIALNTTLHHYGVRVPSGFQYLGVTGDLDGAVSDLGQGVNFYGGDPGSNTVWGGGSREAKFRFRIPADATGGTIYSAGVGMETKLLWNRDWHHVNNLVSFTVTPVQSATQVTVAPSVARVGEPVTLTANVSAVHGTNTPTGSVSFAVDGQTLTAPVVNGVASTTAIFEATGTKPVTATFTPASGTEWQTSVGTGTVNVQSEATQTQLTLDPVAIHDGDQITATARLTPAAATGHVVFTVDGQTQRIPVTGGEAQATFQLITSGEKTVLAAFEPANPARYTTSQDEETVAVSELTTTMTVSVNPSTATAGEQIAITADITPEDATGTVTFEVAGRTLTAPVVDGKATVYTSLITKGTYPITATFTSDQPTRWLGSAGTGSVTIQAEGTETEVTVDPATVAVGGEVTLTARVTPRTVDGVVTFTVNGTEYLADVVDGVATTTVLMPDAGDETVRAVFTPADTERYAPSEDSATITVTGTGGDGGGSGSLGSLTGSLGS